jgi:hypothetical protein
MGPLANRAELWAHSETTLRSSTLLIEQAHHSRQRSKVRPFGDDAPTQGGEEGHPIHGWEVDVNTRRYVRGRI